MISGDDIRPEKEVGDAITTIQAVLLSTQHCQTLTEVHEDPFPGVARAWPCDDPRLPTTIIYLQLLPLQPRH